VEEVEEEGEEEVSMMNGRVVNASLVLHGTSSMPAYRQHGPRIYNEDFSILKSPYKVDTAVSSVSDADNIQFSWNNLVGIDSSQRWFDF